MQILLSDTTGSVTSNMTDLHDMYFQPNFGETGCIYHTVTIELIHSQVVWKIFSYSTKQYKVRTWLCRKDSQLEIELISMNDIGHALDLVGIA